MTARATDFQARATKEGRAAQENARGVIVGCGFTIVARNRLMQESGVTINFVVTDVRGRFWYFDVSGSFTSQRAGLIRTDTVWKTLGRASVLTVHGIEPIMLLTTNLPIGGSRGDLALRATQGHTFFDALEMTPISSKLRMRAYARGDAGTRPLPGFWSSDDLYGSRIHAPNQLGANLSVPLQETGDPFGYLASDPKVRSMPHRFKIFMPSRTSSGTLIHESLRRGVLDKVQSELATLGGGFTTYEAQGHWIDPIGGIADERVIVLEAYSTEQPPKATLKIVVDLILQDLDQAAAAIVVDDRMYQFRR